MWIGKWMRFIMDNLLLCASWLVLMSYMSQKSLGVQFFTCLLDVRLLWVVWIWMLLGYIFCLLLLVFVKKYLYFMLLSGLFDSPLGLQERLICCIIVCSTKDILWTCYFLDTFLWTLNRILSLLMVRQGYCYIKQGPPSWSYVCTVLMVNYKALLFFLMAQVSFCILFSNILIWPLYRITFMNGFLLWLIYG